MFPCVILLVTLISRILVWCFITLRSKNMKTKTVQQYLTCETSKNNNVIKVTGLSNREKFYAHSKRINWKIKVAFISFRFMRLTYNAVFANTYRYVENERNFFTFIQTVEGNHI